MKVPVAIVGGGPAGAAAAITLLRSGVRPVIIEKDAFPRYHIGESMTGECGGLVRQLGFEDQMAQRAFPLKHGVKVFGQSQWFVPVMARSDAGLQDQVTWQVRRNEFDHMMQDAALSQGAELLQGRAMKPLVDGQGAVTGVSVRTSSGQVVDVQSEMLLDCSGQNTFLANSGITGEKYLGAYDRQIAVFSQVRSDLGEGGTARDDQPGNTLIFYSSKYHWAWWIPLENGVVSVGVVMPAAEFQQARLSKADFLRCQLHALHPELKRRLPVIEFLEDTRAIVNYSFQVRQFAGKGYICIGDAHRFVDPIFSFGLFVSLKEATLAAGQAASYLAGEGRDLQDPFVAYRVYCEKGIDMLEDTIDCFWEHPLAFARMAHMENRAEVIDLFANRVHGKEPSEAVLRMRRLLKRERSYGSQEEFSVPIGSRYQPERSALWKGADPWGENAGENTASGPPCP